MSAGTNLVMDLIEKHNLIGQNAGSEQGALQLNKRKYTMKRGYLWRDIRWRQSGTMLTRAFNRIINLRTVLLRGKPGYNFLPEWPTSLQFEIGDASKIIAVIPRSNHIIEELRLMAGLTDQQVRREVSEGLDMLSILADKGALMIRSRELYEDPFAVAERICEYLELDFDSHMLDIIDAILGPGRVTRLGRVA